MYITVQAKGLFSDRNVSQLNHVRSLHVYDIVLCLLLHFVTLQHTVVQLYRHTITKKKLQLFAQQTANRR